MKRILYIVLVVLMTSILSSCACYHCPRVYKNRVGIPTSVQVPLYRNMKSNKYTPNNPYYGEPKKKKKQKRKNKR